MKTRFQKIALNGMLGALAIAFSFVDSIVPVNALLPPGVRIGFSNIINMLAVRNVSWTSGIFIALIKAIFAFITRGFMAGVLSLGGGFFSVLVMIIFSKKAESRIGCVGIGVASAAVHNIAQIAIYSLFIGPAAFYYLPIMLILGTASGVLTGLILYLTEYAMNKNKK